MKTPDERRNSGYRALALSLCGALFAAVTVNAIAAGGTIVVIVGMVVVGLMLQAAVPPAPAHSPLPPPAPSGIPGLAPEPPIFAPTKPAMTPAVELEAPSEPSPLTSSVGPTVNKECVNIAIKGTEVGGRTGHCRFALNIRCGGLLGITVRPFDAHGMEISQPFSEGGYTWKGSDVALGGPEVIGYVNGHNCEDIKSWRKQWW